MAATSRSRIVLLRVDLVVFMRLNLMRTKKYDLCDMHVFVVLRIDSSSALGCFEHS